MEDALPMILTWFSPLIAWLPLSGRDRVGEAPVSGRPETYLLMGGSAALLPGLLRLSMASGLTDPSYQIAQAFFQSLALDGVLGTFLPLAVLTISFQLTGRPKDGRTGACRASLIILAYCFVDGIFASGFGPGFSSLPAAFLRSAPKLAVAPLWGYLLTVDYASDVRFRYIAASAVFATVVSGSVAFLISLDMLAVAFIPAVIAFSAALGLRYGPVETAAEVAEDRQIQFEDYVVGSPGRHSVYRLMKEGRYTEACLDAELHLQGNTDLLLYSWQALLRWLGGNRAYRIIFLQRYKALSELKRRKLKRHLNEYLGEYATIVEGWIRAFESLEEN